MMTKTDVARGVAQLTGEGFHGVVNVVEGVHQSVLKTVGIFLPGTRIIQEMTGIVYHGVRGFGRLAAGALSDTMEITGRVRGASGNDAPLDRSLLTWVSAVNGAIGDHLEQTNNPLAMPLGFHHQGREIRLTGEALLEALPNARSHLIILVHGLGMNDLQWSKEEGVPGYGELLEQDLYATVLSLRYNTGRHISVNGREFAEHLEMLLALYPTEVKRLTLIGHSMGGLVIRSACAIAREKGMDWLRQVHDVVCLGTPHYGAPLERLGNWVNFLLQNAPYTESISLIGKVRSAGVKDLRYGWLRDEDWHGLDPDHPLEGDHRPVPLEPHIRYFLVAAYLSEKSGSHARVVGDGLVQLHSALGWHVDPAFALDVPDSHCRVFPGMGHFELLTRPEVYREVMPWLKGKSARKRKGR